MKKLKIAIAVGTAGLIESSYAANGDDTERDDVAPQATAFVSGQSNSASSSSSYSASDGYGASSSGSSTSYNHPTIHTFEDGYGNKHYLSATTAEYISFLESHGYSALNGEIFHEATSPQADNTDYVNPFGSGYAATGALFINYLMEHGAEMREEEEGDEYDEGADDDEAR